MIPSPLHHPIRTGRYGAVRAMAPALALATTLALLSLQVQAKLPAPSPEATAAAAEKAASTAHAGKVAAYKLCLTQDRVAASYHARQSAAGKPAPPATAIPGCTDPGPYAPAMAASKP